MTTRTMTTRTMTTGNNTTGSMTAPVAAIVHDLDQVRAALRVAAEAGAAARLVSPPGASAWLGGGLWAAMEAAARAEFPALDFTLVLDCADRAGDAMAALRAGCRAIRYGGDPAVADRLAAMARASGACLDLAEAPATDLGDVDNPAETCRGLLRDETRDG